MSPDNVESEQLNLWTKTWRKNKKAEATKSECRRQINFCVKLLVGN